MRRSPRSRRSRPTCALETLGVPVVAAINGAALGGGLEIALACHHRIAADVKGSAIGLPEVSLGLLPGGGGVTRTVRMMGIQNAFVNVLSQGTRFQPEEGQGHRPGRRTRRQCRGNSSPPPRRGSRPTPTSTPSRGTPRATGCPAAPCRPRAGGHPAVVPRRCCAKQIKGTNVPAPRAILAAAVEGAQVDFDTASRIESRYFTELATGPRREEHDPGVLFDLQAINAGGSRPEGIGKTRSPRSGAGRGMMGAGIAYVSAKAGSTSSSSDVTIEAAEGQGYREAGGQGSSAAVPPRRSPRRCWAASTPTAEEADFKGASTS